MTRTLGEAFKAAKKDRQVLSKHIIWESGVSKSQFYRILSGKEAPSSETKTKISNALNITTDEFDKLHQISGDSSKPKEAQSIRAGLILASISAILLCSIAVYFLGSPDHTDISPEKIVASPDDRTQFIKDVTIPDGTSIPINTSYIKTWRVKNTGKLVWKHRYLKRMTPASDLICSSPSMVPIPETHPGETIDISVTFMTPHLPGSCRTDWKTADENGNLFFPDMHGLYSIVTVTD